MSLNPLKRIVKSALSNDPIEEVFWGTPTGETYSKVLTSYKMLPIEMRRQILQRCIRKLSKGKQADQIIASLVLLQKLMKIDVICFPSVEPQMMQSSRKKEITMAERNFIRFYYGILKRQQHQSINKLSSLDDQISFCQFSLEKCMQIIKNNIVIEYCLGHSANQVTLRIALREIFEDVKKDLQYTNSFIEANAKLIYEKSTQTSFAINEIYETLIFVSKNIHKITVLIKKAGLELKLPVYQMDRELNMRVEMEMNCRKQEKTKFKTEKLINSRKNINDSLTQKQRLIQSLSEIDEDEIFIMTNEMF